MLIPLLLRQKIICFHGSAAVSLPFEPLGKQAQEVVDGLFFAERDLPQSWHELIDSLQSGDRERYNPLIPANEQSRITVKQLVRSFSGQYCLDSALVRNPGDA